ncbi:unnamed protein product, partial [marine sediment metagenome]
MKRGLNKWGNLMANIAAHPIKSFLVISILVALQTGIVYGAWQLLASDSFVATVTSASGEVVYFSEIFGSFTIDTTNSSQTINRTATIENDNNFLTMLLTINETFNDKIDDGCEVQGDCSWNYYFEGVEVENQDYINV